MTVFQYHDCLPVSSLVDDSGAGGAEVTLANFMEQLLDECHPQVLPVPHCCQVWLE